MRICYKAPSCRSPSCISISRFEATSRALYVADRSILSTICRQRETLLGEKIGRREGKESFLIERDFFFFFSKIAVRKIFTSSRETSRCDPDCNLFECHLRFCTLQPMRLNSLRYELLPFRRGQFFFGKFWEKWIWPEFELIYISI